MALTTSNTGGGGATILHTSPNRTFHPLRHLSIPSSSSSRTLHIASAKKQEQLSSITGKYDSKNRRRRRSSFSTTTDDDDEGAESPGSIVETVGPEGSTMESRAAASTAGDDGYFLPDLPGDKPDFWEGEQWEALGFFVQYMWAFGVVFALIACGIAVATYNEGATDFKETPVYKESIGSRELLEEQPDANSDVFESNPTEVAPSLE